MTPEELAEILARWHEYDDDGITDLRVLEDLHSVIAYVRELEKDRARIDKIIAHLESVRGDDWDAVCMEWDEYCIAFTACMDGDPDKIEGVREAIDNAKGGEQ